MERSLGRLAVENRVYNRQLPFSFLLSTDSLLRSSVTNRMSLSARGHKALSRPPLLKCALFENQFDPHSTPLGLINLGVADNSLMTDWLIEYYREAFARSMTTHDFTYGNALGGSERLFRALKVLCRDYFDALRDVERDHIIAVRFEIRRQGRITR